MPSIAASTWSSEIFSSMNAKALLTSSRISKVVRGLSLAKIKDSICGIRLFISIVRILICHVKRSDTSHSLFPWDSRFAQNDKQNKVTERTSVTLRNAQGSLHESTIRAPKFVTQLSTY